MQGWRQYSLGEVCRTIGGGTPSKGRADYYGGTIPWATVRDMGHDELSATEHTINALGVKSSSTNVIPAGSVIIATRVGLGKVCILSQDTAINQDLRAIIPIEKSQLDTRFLFWWFKSIADLIIRNGTGATVQGVTLRFIKFLQVPLPPLAEQKRIAAILDEAFEGIGRAVANAEKNLANARELFELVVETRLFSEAGGGEWRTATVEDLARPEKGSIRTGPFGSQLLHGEFVGEGIAVLGIDNAVANEFRWAKRRYITAEKYAQLSRYTVKPGDVLITIMGTCGRCAVVPDDIPIAINSKHLCCISLDEMKCLPGFLHAYFLYHPTARNFLAERAKGSIMSGLNMGIIKELPVRHPNLDTQHHIVEQITALQDAVTGLRVVYEQTLDCLSDLRQSILQKAFAGELTKQSDRALAMAGA